MACTEAEYALYGGTWRLVTLKMGGSALSAADLGVEMAMTLNTDGTVAATTNGESAGTGVWYVEEGVLIVVDDADNAVSFEIDEGMLVGEYEAGR